MGLRRTIESLSIGRITVLAFINVLVLMIPITTWLVRQQTRTESKAMFDKPLPLPVEDRYGEPSQGDLAITLVWPFLGKVGDAVLVEGVNLGNNPREKSLKVGEVTVSEADIIRWTPELIEFVVPTGAVSGEVSLTVAGKTAKWDYPFTVYNAGTTIQVTKPEAIISVLRAPVGVKMRVFVGDEVQEIPATQTLTIPADARVLSLEIITDDGKTLPFFVEPGEFGF